MQIEIISDMNIDNMYKLLKINIKFIKSIEMYNKISFSVLFFI
jgi:ribosome-interacting GTPase 1